MKTVNPATQFYLRIETPYMKRDRELNSDLSTSLNFPNGLVFILFSEFIRLSSTRKLIFLGVEPFQKNVKCYKFKEDVL